MRENLKRGLAVACMTVSLADVGGVPGAAWGRQTAALRMLGEVGFDQVAVGTSRPTRPQLLVATNR